ncbi:MAG: hypothetical protein Ta2A_03880 [Treponemataceae bacterium]|nr:MAG: hypothetical protein Ta2A_03880 [Treponemataceae bacterium]
MNKKIVFILILVLIITLISCKSVPEPYIPPPPLTQSVEPPKPVPVGLILDGAQEYVVAERDTLSLIAKKFYNDGKVGLKGYYFPIIRYASDGVASNPDVIEPGEVLVIPNIDINLNDEIGRAKMYEILSEAVDFYDARGDEWTSHRLHELIRASLDSSHVVPPTKRKYPAAPGVPVFFPLSTQPIDETAQPLFESAPDTMLDTAEAPEEAFSDASDETPEMPIM